MDIGDKDVYLYLANFADDRTILNMLSVNRKFSDDKFFKLVVERRYPLLINFKKESQTWKQFYLDIIVSVDTDSTIFDNIVENIDDRLISLIREYVPSDVVFKMEPFLERKILNHKSFLLLWNKYIRGKPNDLGIQIKYFKNVDHDENTKKSMYYLNIFVLLHIRGIDY